MKKTVLITGASSGIGAECAKFLSKEYRIILCGRDEDRLRSILAQCEGKDNIIWRFDISKTHDLESNLSDFMLAHKISIHHFVHCAGMITYLPIRSFTEKSFELIYKTNVISAALILKTLMSRKLNGGFLESVVFISSNISNFGAKAHALYSSSKSALDGMMRSLAMELAPKVRINSVLPGALHTKMTEDIFNNPELKGNIEKTYPMGLGETNDIANAVRFLLSSESKWITGQQLTVDGGRTINLTV